MKTLKKHILFFSLVILMAFQVVGQQDEQSSLYMFNPLQFNPAFAGSRGSLQITGVARNQWIGINGAPNSQFFSLNSPLKWDHMAVGGHFCNDQIGVRRRTSFYGDYAYTLNLNDKSKLNFGLSAGGEQLSVDFQSLNAYDPNETDYLSSFSQFKFNTGFGMYYYTAKSYLGLSVPRLIQSQLSNQSVVLSDAYTKRHLFIMGGHVFPLNSVIDLKASFLCKMVQNAPFTVDLNANLFLYKMIWVGGMYRYNESIGVNLAYQIKEELMFGYAFDYPVNSLNQVKNMGSHEIMLNYSINNHKKAFGSPRYF
jgi:type IX secretion system PorP/SprF family membrane protein